MGISAKDVCSCGKQEGIADTCSVHYPEDAYCFAFEVGQNVYAQPKSRVAFRGKILRRIFDEENSQVTEYLITVPFNDPQWIGEPYLTLI